MTLTICLIISYSVTNLYGPVGVKCFEEDGSSFEF